MPGIVDRDSKFLELARTIMNYTNAFDKEYNKKFAATRVVNIV